MKKKIKQLEEIIDRQLKLATLSDVDKRVWLALDGLLDLIKDLRK